jgi:7-carboxy-7-deazaguanine synthase
MTGEEILAYILDTGVTNVTLTGGEPLLRPGMEELLALLGQAGLYVEIETNGSVPLAQFCTGEFRPSFTMDYKLPSSGMEGKMRRENFACLTSCDTVKFVSGSRADLDRAGEIMEEYKLIGKCAVYLSPVFGQIQPSEMVDWMKEHRLNGVNLQIQMHKVIWPPEQRGV